MAQVVPQLHQDLAGLVDDDNLSPQERARRGQMMIASDQDPALWGDMSSLMALPPDVQRKLAGTWQGPTDEEKRQKALGDEPAIGAESKDPVLQQQIEEPAPPLPQLPQATPISSQGLGGIRSAMGDVTEQTMGNLNTLYGQSEKADKRKMKAIAMHYEAASSQLSADAALAKRERDIHEEWETNQATRQREFNTGMEERQGKVDRLRLGRKYANVEGGHDRIVELQEQAKSDDPEIAAVAQAELEEGSRVKDSRSLGQKVLAGIAAAMGAMGASLTGTRNFALDIINKGIDDDIESQKEAFRLSGRELVEGKSEYAEYANEFEDDNSRFLAMKADKLEQVSTYAKQLAAETGQITARANLENLSAQAMEASVESGAKFTKEGASIIMSGLGAQAGVAGQQVQVSLANKKLQIDQMAQMAKSLKKEKLPDAALQKLVPYMTASKILDDMWVAFKSKTGMHSFLTKHLPATESKMFEDKRAISARIFGKMLEGRMTDEDYNDFRNAFPAADDSVHRAAEKIKTMKMIVSKYADTTLDLYGATGHNVDPLRKMIQFDDDPEDFRE